MKLIAPDYYENFACIADRCKHSCCIGWEIDIDGDTLADYLSVGGAFGERLRAGIEIGEDGACFRLSEDERCPFLNENGLCDIILNLGESRLSQICTDHPRFCSFYGDRTELGLGLCCEEAGRILLSKKDKMRLTLLRDDGEGEEPSEEEEAFFRERDRLFSLAQNRSLRVADRMRAILREYQIPFPERSFSDWVGIFLSLERMDGAWEDTLTRAREREADGDCLKAEYLETAWEQLLCYFLYRHVSDPEADIRRGIFFSVLSVRMLRALFSRLFGQGESRLADLVELCRLYSSEIEYSEENTQLLSELSEDPS